MPRHKYSPEMLAEAVKKSVSVMQVMRVLGMPVSGGAHSAIKRRIVRLGLDTSHFLGVRANQGPGHRPARKGPADVLSLLPGPMDRTRARLLRRSLLEVGREHRCEICGLRTEWRGKPLILHIDHVNGRHNDNRPSNLRFLCPNCHSQTATFAGRKMKQAEVVELADTHVLGACAREGVGVRVPPSAPSPRRRRRQDHPSHAQPLSLWAA
jgi:Zn finger protein HypA/HybF involved in hydrogenase expression